MSTDRSFTMSTLPYLRGRYNLTRFGYPDNHRDLSQNLRPFLCMAPAF